MFPMTEHNPRQVVTINAQAISPMALSDRLITLAKDADLAGYAITAEHLVQLAITIFDEAPRQPSG
jgi:hypothetical protein